MALFGFNKQKVLANAEKYVQQGKLQNAISEYEKVLKNDPKDLTVSNTIGDLYSRIGESDKATECFKNVGDAYAGQGFTVKAIAMYKKISKLKPSLESLLKLAELYTQQGLFNDARAQYLQVAEEFLKAGELENAVRIFQKILEMDPENSNMRVRLAEVYVRLGKKTEAWQIFSSAAESLRAKGSLEGAEEVLQRMLTLDPGNTYALQMQGKNMIESGDAAGAVAMLQKIADIDSNPDGLRDLLKAYLQTGQLSEAGTIANKLLTVHNDLSAISNFADALMQAGQYETALQVYDEHAERLLAENSDKVLEHLHNIIGHVRENPDSLQKLLDLFHKAGETTHVSEVTELLAHASVQSGDLAGARDLYQKLAQLEPQNALHMQNYQQVVSQLGGASSDIKLITPEEAVVLVDDLEATAPSIHQHYTDEVALSVRSALTDAELFISYNMPAKALGPLVAALPLAPNDQRINQRLAALHTRAGRFAEAALCCRTLQSVYSDAGYPEEATRYGELVERYEERSSAPAPSLSAEEAPIFLDAAPDAALDAAPQAAHAPAASPEFSVAEASESAPDDESAAQPWPGAPSETAEAEEIAVEAAEAEFAVAEEPLAATVEPAASPAEIDLSSEWDDSITVEDGASAADVSNPEVVAAPQQKSAERVSAPSASADRAVASVDPAKVAEAEEEIRFYIDNGMPEQAMAVLGKLKGADKAKLAELRVEIEAALHKAVENETQAAAETTVEELTSDDIPSVEVSDDEIPIHELQVPEIQSVPAPAQAKIEKPVGKPAPGTSVQAAAEEIEVAAERSSVKPASVKPASVEPEPVAAEAERQTPGVLKEFVSDLESSLGEQFLPSTVAKPAAKTHVADSGAQPAVAAAPAAPVLGEFVADIEDSLGDDFLKAAPVAEPEAAAPPATKSPAVTPAKPAKITPPMAASAAASAAASSAAASSGTPASAATPQPQRIPPVPAAAVQTPSAHVATTPTASTWSTPVAEVPKMAPVAPHAPVVSVPSGKTSPFGEDAGVDLAEMFGELKQDLESGVSAADEDPETHYSLGIAFREMGLLDEAIGELQKACQSFDRGHPFPQILQTYTWLAQCFLEKGVPEAAVRWYDKALGVQGIDGETRVALNYELASAYETAGDKPAALKHFMDVYGSNIDYRDVAERIQALKS